MNDLSTLTASTGDEFAMFTTGGRRIIIRGGRGSAPVNVDMASELSSQGWRWSAHTHPGYSSTVLTESNADKIILQQFTNQGRSSTLNSVGRYQTFSKDWSDWLPR